MINIKNLVFGLDIGTRSIIGVVGYQQDEKFIVVESSFCEHQERAMMDGQVHDIEKVANTVRFVKNDLENKLGRQLKDVAIAAAGRVLNTQVIEVEKLYEDKTQITKTHIEEIELYGVEKAQEALELEENVNSKDYFCVGHSVMSYYLDDYLMTNLEGHKGTKVSIKLLATFLPKGVVESLYAVTNMVELKVSHLTLEPIAAIQAIIPPQLRLLNLALVDVGAGTSDIAITKDGSILGYGMIPTAGDEVTEALVHKYLVDFNTADRIKQEATTQDQVEFEDVVGMPWVISKEEIEKVIEPSVTELATLIADKIIKLNNGAPNAVFCVGGGSQILGLTQKISEKLDLIAQRVALKKGSDVAYVVDENRIIEGPQMVTPYGICMVGAKFRKTQFIEVEVQDKIVQMIDTKELTVLDALVQASIPHTQVFPKRGESLFFKIDQKRCRVRGGQGVVGQILLNEKEVGIDSKIEADDKIKVIYAQEGKDATATLKEYGEPQITVFIGDDQITLPIWLKNGDCIFEDYQLQNNDEIIEIGATDLEELEAYLEKNDNYTLYVNGEIVDHSYILKDQDKLYWESNDEDLLGEISDEELDIDEGSVEEDFVEEVIETFEEDLLVEEVEETNEEESFYSFFESQEEDLFELPVIESSVYSIPTSQKPIIKEETAIQNLANVSEEDLAREQETELAREKEARELEAQLAREKEVEEQKVQLAREQEIRELEAQLAKEKALLEQKQLARKKEASEYEEQLAKEKEASEYEEQLAKEKLAQDLAKEQYAKEMADQLNQTKHDIKYELEQGEDPNMQTILARPDEPILEPDDPRFQSIQRTILSQHNTDLDNVITVKVNGKSVNIPKDGGSVMFVKVFDYIDFDLKTPQGMIQLKLNGKDAQFTDPLNHADSLEIFWKK
ncbi:MAG: hypothetical protein ATN36_07755 [Epulopiscium sp. Nele67-Bin005]|nr:MAG: hypothetical protein ATN36_07755 [Epulopiscium sp. Nele67-Bin005]